MEREKKRNRMTERKRKENKSRVDPNREAIKEILTRFEITRMLGTRAEQIENGAKSTVDIVGLKTVEEIVKKEYFQKKIPLIIVRTLPNGKVIEIDPNKI